jgi:hypothetical protein
MALSPQDAAAALRDIKRAEARSATLDDYQRAAPHFLIWGVLWAVGYSLSNFYPRHMGAIWAVIVPIGIAAGFAAMRGGRSGLGWRYGAAVAAVFVFFCSVFVVMWPVGDRQIAAFIPLFVALAYVLRGIWSGLRYVAAGALVAALTLAGFFLLEGNFFLWMAGVGGGSLMLAGLWLRRA